MRKKRDNKGPCLSLGRSRRETAVLNAVTDNNNVVLAQGAGTVFYLVTQLAGFKYYNFQMIGPV
jgi:hypothetical protein